MPNIDNIVARVRHVLVTRLTQFDDKRQSDQQRFNKRPWRGIAMVVTAA